MQGNTSFIVFIQFFSVLDRLFKSSGFSEPKELNIRNLFLSELTSLGLRSAERKTVIEYCKQPVGALSLDFQPRGGVLKRSVQSVYEILCNVIGPTETDKLFGRTLEVVSKSRASQAYSPRKFL